MPILGAGPVRIGTGVITLRDVACGEVMARLSGELISVAEMKALGDRSMYPFQIAPRLYLMPAKPLLYLNHSCAPNAGIQEDLLLVALQPIPAGQEVTIDYSTTMLEEYDRMPCRCGAPGCRGIIGDFDQLPATLRAHYLAAGVVLSFIRHRIAGAEAHQAPH